MELDPTKDLEIIAHVLTIAKTHQISTDEALDLYTKKLEVQYSRKETSGLSTFLQEILTPESWETIMYYVKNHLTSDELSQMYNKAKKEGKLKLVKLLVAGDFYFRNSDFVGKKYLSSGITLEAEVYDNKVCHVWLSPTECEFMFIEELEFI